MSAFRRFAIVLLLGALPACDDDAGGLEAQYALFELGGQPLPYSPASGCCIFTSGSLLLSAGNYGASLTLQDKTSSMISIVTEQGTYAVSGSIVAFQRITGGTFNFNLSNALVSGRIIRLQLGGSSPGAGDQFASAFRR